MRTDTDGVAAGNLGLNIRLLLSTLDSIPGLIAYWDSNLICQYANAAYQQWFGKPGHELFGIHIRDVLGRELFEQNLPFINRVLAGEAVRFERAIRKPDGTRSFTLANYNPDFDGSGVVRGFSVLASDITELKRTQWDLEWSAKIVEASNKAILVTDELGRILSSNASCNRLAGYTGHELISLPIDQLGTADTGHLFEDLLSHVADSGTWSGEISIRTKDGAQILCDATLSIILGSERGDVARLVLELEDISGKVERDKELHRLATRDALTDLDNRSSVERSMGDFLMDADGRNEPCAALFVDIDDLKSVNDTFGHEAGDKVLRHVAKSLKDCVRNCDIVARMGGDEFIVLLESPIDQKAAFEVANRILSAVRRPVEIDGQPSSQTVSVGIAVRQPNGLNAEELLSLADSAMYDAKRAGKDRVHFMQA